MIQNAWWWPILEIDDLQLRVYDGQWLMMDSHGCKMFNNGWYWSTKGFAWEFMLKFLRIDRSGHRIVVMIQSNRRHHGKGRSFFVGVWNRFRLPKLRFSGNSNSQSSHKNSCVSNLPGRSLSCWRVVMHTVRMAPNCRSYAPLHYIIKYMYWLWSSIWLDHYLHWLLSATVHWWFADLISTTGSWSSPSIYKRGTPLAGRLSYKPRTDDKSFLTH